ncbi:hypothetical protein ABFW14_21405 [Mycolicibacterium fortuitum]|uniref:hypothetical protein n=1 Tax=Mycobacteriaceae TaxID=1762 RepID=UPI0034CDBE27
MQVLIGAAPATVMFWLAIVAATVAYIIDHAFAITVGVGAAVVVITAIVVARLLARRSRPAAPRHQAWPAAPPPTYPSAAYPDLSHRFQEMPR